MMNILEKGKSGMASLLSIFRRRGCISSNFPKDGKDLLKISEHRNVHNYFEKYL